MKNSVSIPSRLSHAFEWAKKLKDKNSPEYLDAIVLLDKAIKNKCDKTTFTNYKQ